MRPSRTGGVTKMSRDGIIQSSENLHFSEGDRDKCPVLFGYFWDILMFCVSIVVSIILCKVLTDWNNALPASDNSWHHANISAVKQSPTTRVYM